MPFNPTQTGPLWRIASARMPTRWGLFDAIGFERDVSNGTRRVETALAIVMGDLTTGTPLLRIHSQCFTGEVLGSLRCDCHDQLEMAMQAIADEGRGLVIYEYQEGRGIGLMAKLEAYELQDFGLDTIEANHALGFKADCRDFSLPAVILRDLGITRVRLLSNNPRKAAALARNGIDVVAHLVCEGAPNPHSLAYLRTKKGKDGPRTDPSNNRGRPSNARHRGAALNSEYRRQAMDEIFTERASGVLRIKLNRPTKKNAMTAAMYVALADVFNEAARDDRTHVVLWHGAGDSFCAGNDIQDFLANPPAASDSPQARLMNAFVDFDKPLVAAVHGAAIGGGTTMLTHCDFVYAGESARFQMPFIHLALVPEFGSSCSVPARLGHLRAAELILLGVPFDAKRAAELGLVTRVVPDEDLLATAAETARKLAAMPVGALQAGKRLMKQPFREQIKAAMTAENEEFSAQVRSADAKEALAAFLDKRPPRFAGTTKSATAA